MPASILRSLLAAFVLCVALDGPHRVTAQEVTSRHRWSAPGETFQDARNQPLRSLNSYFPFEPPATVEAWNQRAHQLRQHLAVSLGLWPMPTRTPLNAVIHGKIDQGDYTIEKVFFESMPGFFVTGNLYRPKNFEGKIPGVLCPHGHYRDGRFRDAPEPEIDAQIENGAEQFRSNARSPLQARCAHLARMGCTVFHYDMLGYADSQQIPHQVAHGFSTQQADMNVDGAWRLFSPRAEAHLQSVMGLQTWNSIRSLDFLESLPEVDGARLGVTGSSGGGTQTFILCAIDPRPMVAFPAVMVSTAMQGGCTCENCCYLRVGTGNVEIAALFAAKPLGLTAADDWTKEMETKGFPQLKQLYDMLGRPENVHLTSRIEFGHNYNQVSREAMYRWFKRHLGLPGPTEEKPIEILTPAELTVWNEKYPRPPGGKPLEARLLQTWARDTQQQRARQETPFGIELAALETMIGISARSEAPELVANVVSTKIDRETILHKARMTQSGLEHSFLTLVVNRQENTFEDCVLWLHGKGKQGLLDGQGDLQQFVKELYKHEFGVVGMDAFMQGEFVGDSPVPVVNRRIENGRAAAGYTYGYNRPLFLSRVRDVVHLVQDSPCIRTLVALDETAPVAIVAAALLGDRIERLAVNTRGFRFADAGLYDADFFPGGAKYGDLPTFLAMSAPRDTFIFGETESGQIRAAFASRGAFERLRIQDDMPDNQMSKAVVDWILASNTGDQ